VPAQTNAGPQRSFMVLATLVLTGLILYYAQRVLIPVALSILLAFVLMPLVGLLQRRGLPRITAALIAVLSTFVVIGAAGWLVGLELQSLARELPAHEKNITAKIASLQSTGGGAFDRLKSMVQDLSAEFEKVMGGGEGPPPQLVRIERSNLDWLPSLVGPMAESLAMALLVVILVVFMLIRREDLRNRVLRLVGTGRLTLTTRALDDATQRISRFLLMQSVINLCFGILVMVGLRVIGVPYAFLWGLLAAILRFVPYVGIWVAMTLPVILSMAVYPGWLEPILVLATFLCLELITANVVEPLLFSHSTGISPVALLVAVVFWTWLWGPIGLIMATPLTTCLVVLGKFVPQLEFFDVLLGDEPVLQSEISYYQRLLARDHDEAAALVEEYLAQHPVEHVYDDMLLPALSLAKRDGQRGDLSNEDLSSFEQATRDILEDIVVPQEQIKRVAHGPLDGRAGSADQPLLLGCPARDAIDELSLEMFGELLETAGCRMEIAPVTMLTSEMLSWVKDHRPALVCIGSVPPGGVAHGRYLCKRLRAQFPEIKIMVGRWGPPTEDITRVNERFRSAGADLIATTLQESRSQALPLLQTAATAAGSARAS